MTTTMSQHGPTQSQNLEANVERLLKYISPFWYIMHLGASSWKTAIPQLFKVNNDNCRTILVDNVLNIFIVESEQIFTQE